MNDDEKELFIKLMNKSNKINGKQFKLIYRGSKDGWDAYDFHKNCDNKGPTVCIIYTDTNNIFGGYTSISWNSKFGDYSCDDTFVFLIRSSKNYKSQIFNLVKQSNYVNTYTIRHHKQWMCLFGTGHDIQISSNCNIHNSWTKQASFSIPKPYYLNGDKYEFKVKEIEIFTLI